MDQRLGHGTGQKSYLRGPCSVTRWEGDGDESVYERTLCKWSEVWCTGMSEKKKTLRWFGHME